VSPKVTVTQDGSNAVITVTDKDGTTSATIASGGAYTAGAGIDITNGIISATGSDIDLSSYATIDYTNLLVNSTQTMVTDLRNEVEAQPAKDITNEDISS